MPNYPSICNVCHLGGTCGILITVCVNPFSMRTLRFREVKQPTQGYVRDGSGRSEILINVFLISKSFLTKREIPGKGRFVKV